MSEPPDHDHAPSDDAAAGRRGFLTAVTCAMAAVGACACTVPFLGSLAPPPTLALDEAPLEIDLAAIAPGTQRVVTWRDHPIFAIHRTDDEIAALQDPALLSALLDPDSRTPQQPSYARNWHRSIDPRFGIYVGICTHLGCVPDLAGTLYHCPCHGSRFDLAGRVHAGSPARLNLPVPPYTLAEGRARLGDKAGDPGFALDAVRAL